MIPVLAIDVSYLAHQAKFALGKLTTTDGLPTGIIYGVLMRLLSLGHHFRSNRLVFCFDGPIQNNPRRKLHPGYKLHRHEKETPQEREINRVLYDQVRALREEVLPLLGFRNIFYDGVHEADDWFARVTEFSQNTPVIMISNDADLYQLLRPGLADGRGVVTMWDPSDKEMTTADHINNEFGIAPAAWVYVKAMAGCDSDEVLGLPGIGIKTAAKYLRRDLPETTKAHQTITSENGRKIAAFNLLLVRLPYPSTPQVKANRNEFSFTGLMKVCAKYDIASFMDPPYQKRWMDFMEARWDDNPEVYKRPALGRVSNVR